MKIFIFAVIVLAIGIAACGQPGPSEKALSPADEQAAADASRAIQAITMAIEVFEKGDKESVAGHIQEGINALADESESLGGDTRMRLKHAILRLEYIREELLAGKITTVDGLKHEISKVERDVPHKLLSVHGVTKVAHQK